MLEVRVLSRETLLRTPSATGHRSVFIHFIIAPLSNEEELITEDDTAEAGGDRHALSLLYSLFYTLSL